MVVADTTILVAILDSAHPGHGPAVKQLHGLSSLHIPSVVVAELALVLRRLAKDRGHDGNRFARQALKALLAKHEVHQQQRYDAATAFQLYAADSRLSYVDAVTVATAWELGEGLATLDKHQRGAWSKRLP